MNEKQTKELEMHLRSWSPRPPSTRVGAAIFRAAKGEDEVAAGRGVQWLVPGMAAMLTVLMLVGQRAGHEVERVQTAGNLAAMVLSNQSAAASFSATSMQTRNTLTADTFEWTNGSASLSSIYSISPRKGSNH